MGLGWSFSPAVASYRGVVNADQVVQAISVNRYYPRDSPMEAEKWCQEYLTRTTIRPRYLAKPIKSLVVEPFVLVLMGVAKEETPLLEL